MQRNACPACGFSIVELLHIKGGFEIIKCANCKTMFVGNVPGLKELEGIYSMDDYYQLRPELVERIEFESTRRFRILTNYKSSGSYFEIGCARGIQLDQAQKLGFQTFGVELSSANVDICQKKGHNVVCGYLEDFASVVPDGGFDVVSCLDVVEHVENPLAFLDVAVSMLSKDGIMVVSTPNYSGIVAKLLGLQDPFLIPPEHLNFFTKKGMRELFQKTGLKELKMATFGMLTENEVRRVTEKYFVGRWFGLEPLVWHLIPFILKVFNIFKIGLEQEFYLSKK